MKPPATQQRFLDLLVAMARAARRPPSRREFLTNSGLSENTILRFFPTWTSALQAAGLEPYTANRRLDDREILEDWGRVTRKNRKIPSRRVYCHVGKFDHRTVARRFARWSQLPQEFRKFAQGKPEWAGVLALLPSPSPSPSANRAPAAPASPDPRRAFPPVRFSLPGPQPPSSPPLPKIRHSRLRGRPTFGQPMDFRGLRHEPVNEQGVVLLFGMVAKELGYIVEAVQSAFPDCEAKRQIAPHRWQRVHIEFEFESRNFRDHGHSLTGCDVIVCWRHNWPDCPPHLEILELSTLIKSLPHSNA